jgi:hypothetical protein
LILYYSSIVPLLAAVFAPVVHRQGEEGGLASVATEPYTIHERLDAAEASLVNISLNI